VLVLAALFLGYLLGSRDFNRPAAPPPDVPAAPQKG
jgi:hypothetical protein